ncbi:MAG: sugar phosphate isomerase/epimerase [Spirochaetales bacterium]|nr:sugar phosphate isomerase/epimerase [Spirochaetales bacterium]MCF7938330.1 sugar phosphate isomerase/epimerase [Spirochaetales bacterium]
MTFTLGIKSDPIEYRYSFSWLFRLMKEMEIHTLQLGSFPDLYFVEDDYFLRLREQAETFGIRIKSAFTAHRELGGFFADDPALEKAARTGYERLIHVAALLGGDFAGSNPGAVYRDKMETKEKGINIYLKHMKELMEVAKQSGLQGLTMEPMSCLAEPPSFPEEIERFMNELGDYHRQASESTVPAYLCSDISHGIADSDGNVLHSHFELFEYALPWMAEFHIKNTDNRYSSTFGFGGISNKEETPAGKQGIVSLKELKKIFLGNRQHLPLSEITGYLEINGPKLGRDYSDHLLEKELRESLETIQKELV